MLFTNLLLEMPESKAVKKGDDSLFLNIILLDSVSGTESVQYEKLYLDRGHGIKQLCQKCYSISTTCSCSYFLHL